MENTNYSYDNEMEVETPKKMKLIKRIAYSFVPNKYKKLSNATMGGFILMLIAIFLLSTVLSVIKAFVTINSLGGINEIVSAIPDFEYVEGELRLKEEYNYYDKGMYINASFHDAEYTQEDIDAILKEKKDVNLVCLIGNYNILIFDENGLQTMYFKDFDMIGNITKDTLTNVVAPIVSWIILFYYSIIFLTSILMFFFMNLLYCLIAYIFASGIFRRKLSFVQCYKIALCSRVPALLVNIVLSTFFMFMGGGLTGSAQFFIASIIMMLALKNYGEENNKPQIPKGPTKSIKEIINN